MPCCTCNHPNIVGYVRCHARSAWVKLVNRASLAIMGLNSNGDQTLFRLNPIEGEYIYIYGMREGIYSNAIHTTGGRGLRIRIHCIRIFLCLHHPHRAHYDFRRRGSAVGQPGGGRWAAKETASEAVHRVCTYIYIYI